MTEYFVEVKDGKFTGLYRKMKDNRYPYVSTAPAVEAPSYVQCNGYKWLNEGVDCTGIYEVITPEPEPETK